MKATTQDDFYNRISHERITMPFLISAVSTIKFNLAVNTISSDIIIKWNRFYHFCIGKIIYLFKDM